MKAEQVTYDKFLQIVERMRENDEKLTVRNVLARTGGSFGKVSEFLKRFEKERSYLGLARKNDISDALRKALLTEIAQSVTEATTGMEQQVAQLTIHLDEANEQLNEQEKTISSLREEVTELKDKLMLMQKSISDLESSNYDFKQQLEDVQKEKGLAMTEVAKSKLQLERADNDLLEIKKQNKMMQEQIMGLTREKYEAEKSAAVAEAKFEQLARSRST